MDALNHLTWAGKDAITDGSFRPFNELLCLGYMEEQSISVSNLHDMWFYEFFLQVLMKF